MPEFEPFAVKASIFPQKDRVSRTTRMVRWSGRGALLALAGLVCAGCGAARSPCSSESCPTATVCDLDGTCRPMPEPGRATMFSESVGVYATGFGNPDNRRGGSPGASDRLLLGGDAGAVIDLTFFMPTRRRSVVEAVLVLFPHPHARTATEPATIAVGRMRPGRANGNLQGMPLRPIGRSLSSRVERPSARQALRLDVLDAAREVVDAPLALRVRMERGGDGHPWIFASPQSLDAELRPRLELLMR